MNYQRIYDQLIQNAKTKNNVNNTYYEVHHIIPKCLGGDNSQKNLVRLTLREHYIAHKLLAEIYKNNKSIWHAYWMMTILTLGALENFKNENYLRCDGTIFRRQKSFLAGEKINITSREYEYCKLSWQKIIKGTKRTEEQRKRISEATKKAMRKSETMKKCRSNLGSHYYYDIKSGDVHKWFPGDPDIDLNKYAWGRSKLSEEQKKKISHTQRLEKTLCQIGESQYRYIWYKDYVVKIPECLKDLKCKNKNSLKKISPIIHNALFELINHNIFIKDDIIFTPDKSKPGLNIVSPAVYEVCLDLLEQNIIDPKILGKRIYDNIDKIKQLNLIYLNNF